MLTCAFDPQQVPLGLSKKDPVVRRRELLGSGKGSLAARLLSAVADGAVALLHGKNSGELITEAVRGGSDGGPRLLLKRLLSPPNCNANTRPVLRTVCF